MGILILTTMSVVMGRPACSKDGCDAERHTINPIDAFLKATPSPLVGKLRPKRQLSHFGNYLFVPDYYDYNQAAYQPRPIRGTGSKTTKLPHYSVWDLTRKR